MIEMICDAFIPKKNGVGSLIHAIVEPEKNYELILDDTPTEDTLYNLIFDKRYMDVIIFVSVPIGNVQPTFTPNFNESKTISIEINGLTSAQTQTRVIVARLFKEYGRWRSYRSNSGSYFYNTTQERFLNYYDKYNNLSDAYIDRFVMPSSPIKARNRVVIYGRRAD